MDTPVLARFAVVAVVVVDYPMIAAAVAVVVAVAASVAVVAVAASVAVVAVAASAAVADRLGFLVAQKPCLIQLRLLPII